MPRKKTEDKAPEATKKAAAAKCAEKKVASVKAAEKAPTRRRVTFQLVASHGSKVCVAGSFNEWSMSKNEMTDKKGTGTYTATILLAPGTYEYKFVVDGIWTNDAANEAFVMSSLGTYNNVITVE